MIRVIVEILSASSHPILNPPRHPLGSRTHLEDHSWWESSSLPVRPQTAELCSMGSVAPRKALWEVGNKPLPGSYEGSAPMPPVACDRNALSAL